MSSSASLLAVGTAIEDWTGDARYFEYTRAANPIGSGQTPKIPLQQFPAALHETGTTGIVELDLSEPLGITHGPATSPALCASFACIQPGDQLQTRPVSTSELYFVLRGSGRTAVEGHGTLAWGQGDFFVLPAGAASIHEAI